MKLPKPLLLAIARYYINRSNQYKTVYRGDGYSVLETNKSKWDKDGDLKFIDDNCPKDMSYSAISGTFWFTKGKKKIEVNQENFCKLIV